LILDLFKGALMCVSYIESNNLPKNGMRQEGSFRHYPHLSNIVIETTKSLSKIYFFRGRSCDDKAPGIRQQCEWTST